MPRITRREFVGTVTAAGAFVPAARVFTAGSAPSVTSAITIPPPGEPGTPLVVSGRIVAPDGRTPLGNMTLRVYHTDSEGYYTRPVSDPRRARLRGSLRTDTSGRYEIRTIWPGHYPGTQNPRHIHVHLEGADVPEHWIDSFLFEGDPYLRTDDLARSRDLGKGFAFVMAMARGSDGVIRCTRDIRLDREVAERNRLVDGWYRGGEQP
jgi:protocatechuate 3,4-dioxygenase beta subunit